MTARKFLPKIAALMFVFCIGFSAAAHDVSEIKPEFQVGGGYSVFGPEASFVFRYDHFETELACAADIFAFAKNFGVYDSMAITPKLNIGFVFSPLFNGKLRFSAGANTGFFIPFETKTINATGGYLKAAWKFTEHFEMAVNTYIPVFVGDDQYLNKNDLGTEILARIAMGSCFTSISCRYCF